MNRMSFYLVIFLMMSSHLSWANEDQFEKKIFKNILMIYKEGKYLQTLKELDHLLNDKNIFDQKIRGIIYYWKGLCHNRSYQFLEAELAFKKSMALKNIPRDLFYELAQSLFMAEKLKEAKIYFSESFKQSFKRAASLYYLAFISEEMEDFENAKILYQDILKLPGVQNLSEKQAAKMKLTDIHLREVEKKSHVFTMIEDHIIPGYEDALKIKPDSTLAKRIREKMRDLKVKYEMVLLKLRNGRPTQDPPYFFKLSQEVGYDSNVTFSPQETTIEKSKQGSSFAKTDLMGRYTFYHKNYFSYAPELRFVHSYYFNREPEIYRNDNYLLAPSLRTSYEHSFKKKPASFMVDYDFNYSERDVRVQEKLQFSSKSHALTLSERFHWSNLGETIVRLRNRMFESFIGSSNSQTWSLILEQTIHLKKHSLLLLSSLDQSRVENNAFDTNSFSMRGDFLFAPMMKHYSPSVGLAITLVDPINDRDSRGLEYLINPNFRMTRSLNKNWRLNSRYEYFRNVSKDKLNFDYKKNLFGIELEYLY